MKSIITGSGRIAVILVAALLVVGITMSVVNPDSSAQFPSDRGDSIAQNQNDAGDLAQTDAAEQPSGEFHGPTEQSLVAQLAFGLLGILQNSVIIGVIVWVVHWSERRLFNPPAKALAG